MKVKLDLDTYNLKEIPEGRECRDYFNQSLDAINARIKNLTTTVDDFRNFYKPHKELTLISITQPIRQAVNIAESSFSPQRISITETYHSFESLLLHSNEVVHVILNILKNSQDNFKEKKTPNPQIHIQTYEKDENHLCIEICDNGGGIPEEVIDKVYDPYFSTKDEKNGSGLGLYMSKVIIEEHHKGTLAVKNRNEGLCTIITFKKTPNTLNNTEEVQ
jgi:nitrogen fixation/metabolism regulation signal transduction histidine kinase